MRKGGKAFSYRFTNGTHVQTCSDSCDRHHLGIHPNGPSRCDSNWGSIPSIFVLEYGYFGDVDSALYLEFPLVDTEIRVALFSPILDKEMSVLQHDIWRGIRQTLPEDLTKLSSSSLDDTDEYLHKIFGYASNAGLLRLGMILESWMECAQPHGQKEEFLPIALETAAHSVAEMERLYPHLAT